jgi:stage III sporulation protein AH
VERERVRGRQTEMLQNIINDRNTEKAAREAASTRLMNISADMEKEMKAENLVKSLGFSDCVVISQAGFMNVILQSESVNEDEEKEIKNILGTESGGKIKVTAVKPR